MSSNIYNTIVKRKIDNFIGSFISDANSIFKENVKLLHPGEYGIFREETLRELLIMFLDKTNTISNGFIITSNNEVSTQCDLLIYNSNIAPLIGDGVTRFFPVEEINGIIEVKSTLTKQRFKQALIKMAKNKMLTQSNVGVIKNQKLLCGEMNDMATYLVCAKFDFALEDVNFNNLYGDIPQRYWHNGILSIEDGYWSYRMHYKGLPDSMHTTRENLLQCNSKQKEDNEYPVHIEGTEIYKTVPFFYYLQEEHIYSHILDFVVSLNKVLGLKTTYRFDTIPYLGLDFESFN